MLHAKNSINKHKAGLINLAEKLSNASKACKAMGVSRDTFSYTRNMICDSDDKWLGKHLRSYFVVELILRNSVNF